MGSFFVPDGVDRATALARVTHLAIGAHQDDLEIFAYHGIESCYESDELWFGGVTVTDGAGSARSGPYQDFTDEQMQAVRALEQEEAARLGRYSFQAQLDYASAQVKDSARCEALVDELVELLETCVPHTLYLHNPADKHDSHVAVLLRCVEAIRRLSPKKRPETILGCEVWRDLDWLEDSAKVMLPVDRYPELAGQLLGVFASQVQGGKDYVRATLGRRQANATYFASHAVDQAAAFTVALDLGPIFEKNGPTLEEFAIRHVDCFKEDVRRRLRSL